MITFTRRVGTSPGTTVLTQDNGIRTLGVQQCRPVPQPIHIAPDQSRASTPKVPSAGPHATLFFPYSTPASFRGGNGRSGELGFVLAPWEINRTLASKGPYLKPFDPQYITRGERGWYYDTQLGGLGEIPTDAEYGQDLCYTPVKSGWIYSGEGYIPPPYVPPDEWRPVAPQFGPPTAPLDNGGALGEAAGHLGDVADELAAHQKRMFYLSIVSTSAVVAVAIATVIKAMRSTD
jgi:hypothetical protein